MLFRNVSRERGSLYFKIPKIKEGDIRLIFQKLWFVGEHQRTIHVICCPPYQVFLCTLHRLSLEIQINWHETRLQYCVFGDSPVAKLICEKECQSVSRLFGSAIYVPFCETANIYKLIITSKYGMR